MPVQPLPSSRPTKPLERVFVNMPRKRPLSPGGYHYLMIIEDDFSRFGWTYVLKQQVGHDVPAVLF